MNQCLTILRILKIRFYESKYPLVIPKCDVYLLVKDEQLNGKIFEGRGMPISKKPGTFGDLKLEFEISFPNSLSSEKRSLLAALL